MAATAVLADLALGDDGTTPGLSAEGMPDHRRD